MKKMIFESTRTFVLFSYGGSHGLLLLRSRKTTQHPKRIDILFQDVRAMELRSWFEGVRIEEVNASFLQGQNSKPEQMVERGNKIYAIHGADWSGFIVGGIVSIKEDGGEFNDPSELLQPRGRGPSGS